MGQTHSGRLGLSGESAQRMVKALFDTNVLVDYLNAVPQARTELQRYTEKAVSIITWMEVMVGATGDVEVATRSFLSSFDVIALDGEIAERAVNLRRNHHIKLPDAIILATAQVHAMLLVTRNTKDFSTDDPSVRMPYSL
jgi:predicted nucleic acid-binding protein